MRHSPTLSDFLESEAGETLTQFFREQILPAGTMLRDDCGDQILIVRTGRLRVYLATQERELSLTYLLPGDAFSTHTRAQLSAQENSRILIAPRRLVERQLGHFPLLQEAIFRVLAATLSQSLTMIEDLAFHPVRGRLARYLLRQTSQQPDEQEAGIVIQLALSMEEIATLIGTTRQTASTELNAMVKDGVIARNGRSGLVILQPERLRLWAGEASNCG
ncbi:Crp/Fnr family transcriptional regulator [Martelella alba]|uniref:Crp/Fnr family transcriptional regulator n=2 Tax=Martelella alba TaxID=2590451 RepID=A0A506UIH9_9HYPH|nr:Crp/Fnr family transcriptional regulator [Martelella alba]